MSLLSWDTLGGAAVGAFLGAVWQGWIARRDAGRRDVEAATLRANIMAGLADHGIIRSYDTIVELRKYAEKYKRIPDLRISAVAFEAPFQGSPLTREEFGVLNQLALTIETINHANKCLDNMQLEQALVVHWAKDEAVKATSERHMRTLATVLAQCETQLSALQPYATSAAWYMPTT